MLWMSPSRVNAENISTKIGPRDAVKGDLHCLIKKLKNKNLDMIVANNLKVEGAGFAGNTNVITMITENEEVSLEKMLKEEAALKILDQILKNMAQA